MASLALMAVGQAVGAGISPLVGGLLGTAGGLAGAFIDQRILIPAVMGKRKTEGNRVDEITLSQTTEGASIPKCFGTHCHVGGTIIWVSPLITEKVTQEVGGGGKGGGGQTVEDFEYYVHVALALSEGEIADVWFVKGNELTITGSLAQVFSINEAVVQTARLYHGDSTQLPDSLIESFLASGNVPAYRGVAYVVLERLALNPFGRRMPTFLARVLADVSWRRPASVIEELIERSGVPQAQDRVLTEQFPEPAFVATMHFIVGYVVHAPQSTLQALEPIIIDQDVDVREADGKLKFRPRNAAPEVSVRSFDLGAHREGSAAPPAMRLTDRADFDIPREVRVEALDQIRGEPTTGKRRRNNPETPGIHTVRIPLNWTPSKVQLIADRLLHRAWKNRVEGEIHLPASYFFLEINDIILLDNGVRARVTAIDRGNNFVHRVRFLVEDDVIPELPDDVGDDDVPEDPEPVYSPPDLVLKIFDVPPLFDAHVELPGYYYATARDEGEGEFLHAIIFRGASPEIIAPQHQQSFEAIFGRVLNDGGIGGAVDGRWWDYKNHIDIETFSGSLQGMTEAEVLAGANTLIIAGEIVSFVNAELIASNTWRLTKLLRGRRDTADHIDAHEDDELAVLVQPGDVEFGQVPINIIGSNRFFTAVAAGGESDLPTPFSTLLSGATLRPFSPTRVRGERQANDDWLITWSPRTRALYRMFSGIGFSHHVSVERYEIDIMLNDAVVRTIVVNNDHEAVYTIAEQQADGTDNEDPLLIRVHQTDPATVGRSKPTEVPL